jgi:hypothetical protein
MTTRLWIFRLGQEKETCMVDSVLSRGGKFGQQTWAIGRGRLGRTMQVRSHRCDCSCNIVLSSEGLTCKFHLTSR